MLVRFQVCHIVLGLRPGTPEEEGQIIRFAVISFHVLLAASDRCAFGLTLTSHVQRLVRTGEQARAAARPELVPHLHAVVAAVEGLCEIRKSS